MILHSFAAPEQRPEPNVELYLDKYAPPVSVPTRIVGLRGTNCTVAAKKLASFSIVPQRHGFGTDK